MSHEYEIGTYIDLSHINRGEVASERPTMQPAEFAAYVMEEEKGVPIGTYFRFDLIGNTYRSFRTIPVQFA